VLCYAAILIYRQAIVNTLIKKFPNS